MSKLDFCIIIPVFNEEKIILDVIDKALKFSKNYKFKIIMVNDGSTDSTKKVLSKIKKKKVIVLHKKNEGHGKAIIVGYKKAIKLKPDFILQADSSDKISFKEFKKLLIFKNHFDFIEGNRKNRNDPLYRILISFILRSIIILLFGQYAVDPNCPLRIFRTNFLKNVIHAVSFSDIPNILISIHAINKKVYKSVDIVHQKRQVGSSIKYFKLLKLCVMAFLDILKFKFLKND